jgi:hypothetical protein
MIAGNGDEFRDTTSLTEAIGERHNPRFAEETTVRVVGEGSQQTGKIKTQGTGIAMSVVKTGSV